MRRNQKPPRMASSGARVVAGSGICTRTGLDLGIGANLVVTWPLTVEQPQFKRRTVGEGGGVDRDILTR